MGKTGEETGRGRFFVFSPVSLSPLESEIERGYNMHVI